MLEYIDWHITPDLRHGIDVWALKTRIHNIEFTMTTSVGRFTSFGVENTDDRPDELEVNIKIKINDKEYDVIIMSLDGDLDMNCPRYVSERIRCVRGVFRDKDVAEIETLKDLLNYEMQENDVVDCDCYLRKAFNVLSVLFNDWVRLKHHNH